MILQRVHCLIITALLAMVLPSLAGTVTADFTSASSVPVTAASYTAAGNDVSVSLSFAPPTGTTLMVVKNTGSAFITGQFSNLAQGQVMNLSYNGVTYKYVANYYGGTGNDLVLQWAYQNLLAWGNLLAGKTVIAFSACGSHSLLLCSDGTVADVANGNTLDMTHSGVLSGKMVIAVAAGGSHCLALCSDGTVAAWGDNTYGQLGNNNSSVTSSSVPLAVYTSGVLSGKIVTSISAGGLHSLALCSDGVIVAWGRNFYGQLGNNLTNDRALPVLVDQSGALVGKQVVQISAGDSHSMALCSDSYITAWGCNLNGRLGNGTTISASVPVSVTQSSTQLLGKTVVSISAGYDHSLALDPDGNMYSWGANSKGQLGCGGYANAGTSNYADHSVPSAVKYISGKKYVAISAGLKYSLTLCSDGTVAGWGNVTTGYDLNGNLVPTGSYPRITSEGIAVAIDCAGNSSDPKYEIDAVDNTSLLSTVNPYPYGQTVNPL
ncbi:MAG: hypothetical protein WCO57_16105 [Verrucomicrobiota bacterium]